MIVAVAWRGGYTQDGRAVVVVLAGLAVLAAIAWTPEAALRASRAPVVVTLAALALLSAVSGTWTIGSAGQAVRDGSAILAIAAVVVVAASLRPAWLHAGVLLAAAVGAALTGLVAAVAASEPLALDICGAWRPAGPFQYPPTLALVCAGALPAALALATERRQSVAVPGAAAGWLLATTVALTANRTTIALAGAALVAAVWLAPRGRPTGPLALGVMASATASALVVGTHLGDAGTGRLLLALAPAVVLCAAAPRIASVASAGAGRRGQWIALVAAAAVATTGGIVVVDRGAACQGDASHGRVGIWRAAIDTAKERPLQGHGSGTFLSASRGQQLEERPRPTRFAHNLALEAWVELGALGVLLVLAWYAALAGLLIRAVREGGYAYLLAPYAAAFPLANLLDWPWHLLGAGILWAVAAGGLLASRREPG